MPTYDATVHATLWPAYGYTNDAAYHTAVFSAIEPAYVATKFPALCAPLPAAERSTQHATYVFPNKATVIAAICATVSATHQSAVDAA